MKMLLVEDNKDLLSISNNFFRDYGFEIDKISSGDKALTMFRDNSYDVIVTDIRLPKLRGDKLIEAIRKENSDILIIGVSAFGNRFRELCIKAGANYFFSKPFSHEKLSNIIKRDVKKNNQKKENEHIKNKRMDEIKNLLKIYSDKLLYLNQQKAILGITADYHIIREILDIESSMKKLQEELSEYV